MLQINMLENLEKISKKWAVYTMRDAHTAKVVHAGVIKLTQFFTFGDFRGNRDKFYIIVLEELCDNSGLAERSAAQLRCQHKLIVLPHHRNTPIQCVTTGEIFSSAVECASAHGLNQAQLSNHLNRKPGFKTVKGKIYEKVVAQQKPL